MTLDELDQVCRALPGVTMVVQWGNSNVYKVAGKVFVIARNDGISFKASEIAYEALVEQGRGQRAPHTTPGTNWLWMGPLGDLDSAETAGLIGDAHVLIAAKLTRKARVEIGME